MSDRLSPSAADSSSPGPSGGQKIRRRNRIITSCLECRRRKLKCDRSHPCNHCTKAKRDCVFLAPSMDASSKNKLNQFKESMESLEKDLGKQKEDGIFTDWNVASQNIPSNADFRTSPSYASAHARPKERVPADEAALEPSPLAVDSIVYDDDNDDLIDDLGIRLGKMRITERIGGFIRPRFSEELADTLRMNPATSMDAPSYAIEPPEEFSPFSPGAISDDGSQSWLEPSAEYLAPGLGLTGPMSITEDTTLLTFLPSKDFADKLLERYWLSVDPIAKVVHRPTFERQYAQFWTDVSAGFEPSGPLQALVFAMLFAASVSMLDEQTRAAFGCERPEMVRTFRMGCEYALSKSNLIRTTRTITIQAFVMYLVPLCRAEVSRAHASLVSMAIRLAECAGFHRDGSHFGLGPVETHVRRLIWYNLCFLDIRVCEAVGPRPTIHIDEFDTRMPLNVNDRELGSLIAPSQDAARFTDNTLNRIRIESTELSRVIWRERPRIEKKETSVTAVMKIIENFKNRMSKKYKGLLNPSEPLHAFAALFMEFVFCKAPIGILHRYVVSTPQDAPRRLTRLVWVNGARQLDVCVEWDTSPVFRPLYSWYLGAMQQWHVALLFVPLLVTMKEPEPETDRVWRALDYVFEFDTDLNRSEKMKLAYGVARKRLEEMQKQRKARLPTALEQRLGRANSLRSSEEPDRRPSSTTQLPSAPQSGFTSNSFGGFPGQTNPTYQTSSNQASDTGLRAPYSNVDSSSNTSSNYQSPAPDPSMMNAMSLNNNSNATSTGMPMNANGQGQFPDIDWDDFNALFPMDDGPVFDQQYFTPADYNQAAMSEDMNMGSMTFFPNSNKWTHPQNAPQPPQQPQQQQWGF